MKYKCRYANDKEGTDLSLVIESVEASTPEEAAKKFDSLMGGALLMHPYIHVEWGGVLSKNNKGFQIFESQKDKEKSAYNEKDGLTVKLQSTPSKNETPVSCGFATIHFVVGFICLVVALILLTNEKSGAVICFAASFGCILTGSILQKLSDIRFYLKGIYKRMK